MGSRGRMIYVPPSVIDEIELIKDSKCLPTKSQAFSKMVEYSRVGREVEQIRALNFNMFKRKR